MKSLKRWVGKLGLRAACIALIVLPTFFIGFHALILAGILPKDIVWGGRLTDRTLVPFELFAIALNLLLVLVGGVAGGFIRSSTALAIAHRIKWFLFYFVLVNTVLALFSTTTFERLLTPVTALYAICLYRISAFSDGFGSGTEAKT